MEEIDVSYAERFFHSFPILTVANSNKLLHTGVKRLLLGNPCWICSLTLLKKLCSKFTAECHFFLFLK